jgi:transposase
VIGCFTKLWSLLHCRNAILELMRMTRIARASLASLLLVTVSLASTGALYEMIVGGRYFHLALRRGRKIAKVAMARRLAIHLYWMWREGQDYQQTKSFGSYVR